MYKYLEWLQHCIASRTGGGLTSRPEGPRMGARMHGSYQDDVFGGTYQADKPLLVKHCGDMHAGQQ